MSSSSSHLSLVPHSTSSHRNSCSSSNSTTTSQTCSRLIDRRQLDCRKAKGDRSMIYDVVDTGLVLGRTYGGTNCSSSPAPSGSKLTKSRNDKKLSDSSSNHSDADEPSLTLGLVAESNRRSGSAAVDRDQKSTHPSSPQSAASSLSNNFPTPNIKRETEVTGNDLQEGSAKKKLRLTKEQSTLLEGSFKEHSTLSPKQKLALAKELDLRPRQVEVWFQNRRARTKLKQTEIDFEFLKRYSESLKEENGRLQKEISQLRTMQLTPGGGGGGGYSSQFNPTSTPRMTLCPSCNTAGDSVHQDASPKCVVARKTFLFNSNIAHHPSSSKTY